MYGNQEKSKCRPPLVLGGVSNYISVNQFFNKKYSKNIYFQINFYI